MNVFDLYNSIGFYWNSIFVFGVKNEGLLKRSGKIPARMFTEFHKIPLTLSKQRVIIRYFAVINYAEFQITGLNALILPHNRPHINKQPTVRRFIFKVFADTRFVIQGKVCKKFSVFTHNKPSFSCKDNSRIVRSGSNI